MTAGEEIRKSFLPLMTQVEAGEAAQRGAVVLFPIGTVEANGPSTPLGYDYLVAEALARRVAERMGNVWVPPISYGVSDVLAGFPGTIFVSAELLSQQIESVLRSLIAHEFTRIVLLNNHIPNQQPAQDACRRVRKDTGVLVPSIYPGQLARDLTHDLYDGLEHTIGHGSEPGGSLMMHVHPGSVRIDLAQTANMSRYGEFEILSPFAVRHGQSQVNLYLDLHEVSPQGAWADPTRADPDRGAEIMRRMEDFVVSFIERFWPTSSVDDDQTRSSASPTGR
jgi:creatinine amidohydrolase